MGRLKIVIQERIRKAKSPLAVGGVQIQSGLQATLS